MKELTCIVCPIGCSLRAVLSGDDIVVTGNRCPRGAHYAKEELTAPRRTVTATCRIVNGDGIVDRLPVKTSAACPRERINDLLAFVYKMNVTLPVKAGDVLAADWEGSGIDILATRTLTAVS